MICFILELIATVIVVFLGAAAGAFLGVVCFHFLGESFIHAALEFYKSKNLEGAEVEQ